MKSLIRKRTVVINGRKTSVSVEDAFWQSLGEIATARRTSVTNVVALIKAHHEAVNLSSAIRVFVLEFYRDRKLPSWIDIPRQSTP
jgi:predicted DNA-binding ribbon-helix-helix protein